MKASRFVKAKETIKQAFKDDPDFRLTYVANVACYLMDNLPGLKRIKQNVTAYHQKSFVSCASRYKLEDA